ncbi:MAG: hypothetical protein H6597_01220 [Flavobacteriales bacterium]|nr:hypothetical protein [Flavobacteriales bacterium]MCB9193127.1 hypothetical protein [Flavobacteriales bacterium]
MKARWLLVLSLAAVLGSWTDKAADRNTYHGITLFVDGPRGGGYADPLGRELDYRIFRVHVRNDTTVPAELTISFPGIPIALLPDTDKFLSVFLFPEGITPATVRDTLDFGIVGSKDFLRTRSPGPTSLRVTILPGATHLLCIGAVFAPDGLKGLTRAELFIDGQTPDASYFPKGSVPTSSKRGDALNLLFGIAVDPPAHHSIIPCGRITFKK